MRLTRTLAFASLLALTSGLAFAAAGDPPKPEELLKMRQGLYEAVKMQFGPLGAFAAGKATLPADAADRAANLAALAKILPSAFAKGTEDLKGSEAKPEAFGAKAQLFQDTLKGFAAETAKLAEIAKAGNADAIKAQAGAVGKTCKGCHEDFRKE